MNSAAIHISDLKLERYVLDELPGDEKEELDSLIKKDSILAARYESILKSNKEIISLYPPESMALMIQWKYNRGDTTSKQIKKPFPFRFLSFAGAFLSIFILVFVMVFSLHPSFNVFKDDETERPKGVSSIRIYRKTVEGAELLSSGVTVSSSDSFQIKYFAADQKYGLIFSIDGNGHITLHSPGTIDESLLLNQGGEVALLESFKLDNAPAFERFFFVTSKKQFEIEEALDAGYLLAGDTEKAKTGELDLPDKFNQESFILLKEGY